METVYLSNEFCKDLFSDNQAGSFVNVLNEPFHFRNGKVALAEVLYTPSSWDNIRAGGNTMTVGISDYPIIVDDAAEYNVHVGAYLVHNTNVKRYIAPLPQITKYDLFTEETLIEQDPNAKFE